jgi:hypothetical protein
MTATQIIAEIETLPSDDRARVVEYVRRVEGDVMPASFLEALEELREGKTIPIVDEHFDQPPV